MRYLYVWRNGCQEQLSVLPLITVSGTTDQGWGTQAGHGNIFSLEDTNSIKFIISWMWQALKLIKSQLEDFQPGSFRFWTRQRELNFLQESHLFENKNNSSIRWTLSRLIYWRWSSVTLRPPPGDASLGLSEPAVEADLGHDKNWGPLNPLLLHIPSYDGFPPQPWQGTVFTLQWPRWNELWPHQSTENSRSSPQGKHPSLGFSILLHLTEDQRQLEKNIPVDNINVSRDEMNKQLSVLTKKICN